MDIAGSVMVLLRLHNLIPHILVAECNCIFLRHVGQATKDQFRPPASLIIIHHTMESAVKPRGRAAFAWQPDIDSLINLLSLNIIQDLTCSRAKPGDIELHRL